MTIDEAAGTATAQATEVMVDGYPLRLDRFYDPQTHHWVYAKADGLLRIGLDGLTADTYGSLAQLVISAAGSVVVRGEPFGSLEAAKFVGPLLAPLSGRITAVNPAVLADPDLVVRSAYDEGWLIDLEPSRLDDEGELLVNDELAHAWFTQAVAEHREKGLVAE